MFLFIPGFEGRMEHFPKKIRFILIIFYLNLFYQFAFCWNYSTFLPLLFTKNYDFEKWSAESFAYVVLFGRFRRFTGYAFLPYA